MLTEKKDDRILFKNYGKKGSRICFKNEVRSLIEKTRSRRRKTEKIYTDTADELDVSNNEIIKAVNREHLIKLEKGKIYEK